VIDPGQPEPAPRLAAGASGVPPSSTSLAPRHLPRQCLVLVIIGVLVLAGIT
jgi:hypothetical protein